MVYFNNTSSQLCKAIIYWVSFSGGLFEAMDTLYDSYFHFCCELVSIGKLMLEPGFRVHDLDHTHLLASCKIVTTLNWKLLTVLEMEPLQRQRSGFSMPVCAKKERNDHWRPFYSQPKQCMACLELETLLKYARHLPLSHLLLSHLLLSHLLLSHIPYPTFLCHQWFKGK